MAKQGLVARGTVGGLYGSARALVVAALAKQLPVVALVADPLEVEGLEDDLRNLAPELQTLAFRPAGDPSDLSAEARLDLSERTALLKQLGSLKRGSAALVPVAVLLEELPDPEEVVQRSLTLRVGERCELEPLRQRMHEAGFQIVPMVAAPADVSLRGDIVDLFPMGESLPVRIELFDDLIESIRSFDPESQRSVRELDSISIALVSPRELGSGAGRTVFLPRYLPEGTLIVLADPARLKDRLEELAVAHGVGRSTTKGARRFLESTPGLDLVAHQIEPGDTGLNLQTLSVQGAGGGVESLAASVASLRRNCERLVLFAESDGELRRLQQLFQEQELSLDHTDFRRGRIRTGFQLVEAGVAILNHLELLGHPRVFRPRPRLPAIPTRAVTSILELTKGDYVVHLTHGIARYGGMVRMQRDQGEEDFLSLEFHGETIFYLPTSQIDLVQRYVGAGATPPRLDKIGGVSWSRKKARVQASLEDLAEELLDVQAARETRGRSVHTQHDPLIQDFESSFPYVDTPDQTRSMIEVHRDFDSSRPMDRLICGDVGFGKTELAIRSAFRMICSGRQVAMLVPTTLLSEQHYQVFRTRFANYPVSVAALSRFRTRKEQMLSLEDLREGRLDLVVGTHRLISKDVGFRDLGLVIVDEEQRFGVKAKEALKRMRRTVDVLTLTATPIPRTLHMALVGIRDISSLNTPPQGRRPVKTELRPFDRDLIRRAIRFELDRGGQVFFVHNRVRSLDRVTHLLSELAPTARIVRAHGQMPERELEAAVTRFARREADVLVSTSIIESGLDLPHANTIIIDRPDLFGLADLHQLRGRVGRSGTQAFCSLLLPEKPLPSVSLKRLKAVEDLSHLGAGYDIAIKDLEIRGAGHLLGASQHGHIAAIGYDLFVRLLRRAVARAKGQPPPLEPQETDVDLGTQAFIPAEYVPDPGQRMELLRRMGKLDDRGHVELRREIRDRFGRIPAVTESLLKVFGLKAACRRIGIRRMLYPGEGHVILELRNPRLFRQQHPFPKSDLVELKPDLWHLRVPKHLRAPADLLDLLSGLF